MKKRWNVWLLVAISFLALAVVATEWWLSPPRGALDANGRRISAGMSLQEVEVILGSHTFAPHVPEKGPQSLLFYDVEGGVVDIELVDRRVVSASWSQPPDGRVMRCVRSWLGW